MKIENSAFTKVQKFHHFAYLELEFSVDIKNQLWVVKSAYDDQHYFK
jgi:hypothetical protein